MDHRKIKDINLIKGFAIDCVVNYDFFYFLFFYYFFFLAENIKLSNLFHFKLRNFVLHLCGDKINIGIFGTSTINLMRKALILSLGERWLYTRYCTAWLNITYSNNRARIIYGIEINLMRVDKVVIRYMSIERISYLQ